MTCIIMNGANGHMGQVITQIVAGDDDCQIVAGIDPYTEQNNSTELYFEESDIEGFVQKLENLYPETVYVNHLMTH